MKRLIYLLQRFVFVFYLQQDNWTGFYEIMKRSRILRKRIWKQKTQSNWVCSRSYKDTRKVRKRQREREVQESEGEASCQFDSTCCFLKALIKVLHPKFWNYTIRKDLSFQNSCYSPYRWSYVHRPFYVTIIHYISLSHSHILAFRLLCIYVRWLLS